MMAMLNSFNPDNSLSLNTDPADTAMREGVVPPKHGTRPADDINSGQQQKANADPERDEVNSKGEVVWASSDPKPMGKAVFYDGMTQLDEENVKKKEKLI